MTIPNSGPVTFSAIQTEFGGTNPISMSEYYAGGSFVPGGTSGVNGEVPSSGAIGVNKFYGTASGPVARAIVVNAAGSTSDHIFIATTGNATVFGNLSLNNYESGGAVASLTRGVFNVDNGMYYTTFATTGSGSFFGGSSQISSDFGEVCSATRGVFIGGEDSDDDANLSLMEYITIATLGDTVSFGVLSYGGNYYLANGNMNSSTRGIIAGGILSAAIARSYQYITIATTGNSTSFGTFLANPGKYLNAAVSSSVRAVIAAGSIFGGATTSAAMEYVTIATTGNGTSFGNLITSRNYMGGVSSTVRGLICGGDTPTLIANIEYITIATTGGGTSFGNLTSASNQTWGTSNAHGGL